MPHISKLSAADLELAGGEDGLRRNQGFYVYRNRRLISWGSWFRLVRQEELTKLARVQVDTSNRLDHLWQLDIKKSKAYPPESLRDGLKQIIARIAEGSRRVFTFRGRKTPDPIVRAWDRTVNRGGVEYRINREHPLVAALEKTFPDDISPLLEKLMKVLEETVPFDAVYADMAAERRPSLAVSGDDENDALQVLADTILSSLGPESADVVKKNKRMLENLETWLKEFNATHNGRIDAPVLIVDDEADSASVNTRPADEDPTTINKGIRSLLRLFTHSSYIGFTATPFANVFIDPETEDLMLGSDLFPRDFIYSLEPPTNYVGPLAIFGDEPRLDPLRPIDDVNDIFPDKHKSDHAVPSLPPSLKEALQAYLLATTIRDLRGEGATHRSMLVNVSRFTSVQDQVASLIHTWLSQAQQDIRNYSQLSPKEALKNSTLAALHGTWKAEFSGLGIEWQRLQEGLVTGVLPVVVQAVNQRTGAASLTTSSTARAVYE